MRARGILGGVVFVGLVAALLVWVLAEPPIDAVDAVADRPGVGSASPPSRRAAPRASSTGTSPGARALDFSSDQFPPADEHVNADHFFIKAPKGKRPRLPDAATVKQFLLQAGAEHFEMSDQDDLFVLSSRSDAQGNHFYKYQQQYQGLEVFNRQLVIQTAADHTLTMMSGQFHNHLDLDIDPELSSGEAVQAGLRELPEKPLNEPTVARQIELSIYVDQPEPALVYVAHIEYSTPGDPSLPPQIGAARIGFHKEKMLVNAHTGELVSVIPTIYH